MLEAFSRSSADGTFTEDEYVQFMRWASRGGHSLPWLVDTLKRTLEAHL